LRHSSLCPSYNVRLMVMELMPKPAEPVNNVPPSPITVLEGGVGGHRGGDLSECLNG